MTRFESKYLQKTDYSDSRTIRDITRTLQVHFSATKSPVSLPPESRRTIQNFVEEHDGEVSEEEANRANLELKVFWEKYVGDNPRKLALFIGVLKELRPAIVGEANILEWWQLVVKPVISATGHPKAIEDAREFLVGIMVQEDDEEDAERRTRISNRLVDDLLEIYIARTRGLTEDDDEGAAHENAQVAQRVEDVLLAFGRKCPKHLFHSLDDLIITADTRLQALTLLSTFLRHQAPHLYLVLNTPLVEHLLKCLMNDTSTTVLSVALTSLIMLLPHIPSSLGPHLPRMFLIYSRLLCWEKFSPLSTEAQRSLVTDDRISNVDADDDQEYSDIGIDVKWEKVEPQDGTIEAATPELMAYFTYLYGLYPLNFMSYIRKPRRYLKAIDFPGADIFDLDQAVIRSRTEQFRQVHLLHPNFYNMTADEELVDPKWPKMDPADVVGECHGLCINSKPSLTSPGPPPTGKLPEVPPLPPLSAASVKMSGQLSPAVSHVSLRSNNSWRGTQSTAVTSATAEGDSPVLRPYGGSPNDDVVPDYLSPRARVRTPVMRTSPGLDDASQSTGVISPRSSKDKADPQPQTNLAHLRQEITLLRNDLNFERWHKAQYSQHISQIMRRNVKEATVEAETLNLINANRALKKQLDQVRKAREATVKDSALTRKQANNLEANMTERFNKLKLEQETWQADADELRRLQSEKKQYRDLLVATEARELNKSHQLELAQRDLEQLQKVQAQLQLAQQRLHEYEYSEFEYDSAKRQRDILQNENTKMQMRLHQQEQERQRLRQAYANKVTELEARLGMPGSPSSRGSDQTRGNTPNLYQQAEAESQSKLVQLKKAHSRLLEKYTDLELEYQYVKSQLDAMQNKNGQTFFRDEGDGRAMSFDSSLDHGYDIIGEYESAYGEPSSDPPKHRSRAALDALGILPSASGDTIHHLAGPLSTRKNSLAANSLASRSSGTPTPATFNPSAPLSKDEAKSAFSDGSDSATPAKKKIQPDSTVRVYGRGMSDAPESLSNSN